MNIAVLGPVIDRFSSSGSTIRSLFPPQSFARSMRGPPADSSLNWQAPARTSSSTRQKLVLGLLPAEDCVPASTMESVAIFGDASRSRR